MTEGIMKVWAHVLHQHRAVCRHNQPSLFHKQWKVSLERSLLGQRHRGQAPSSKLMVCHVGPPAWPETEAGSFSCPGSHAHACHPGTPALSWAPQACAGPRPWLSLRLCTHRIPQLLRKAQGHLQLPPQSQAPSKATPFLLAVWGSEGSRGPRCSVKLCLVVLTSLWGLSF